jgi:hypothetical protein
MNLCCLLLHFSFAFFHFHVNKTNSSAHWENLLKSSTAESWKIQAACCTCFVFHKQNFPMHFPCFFPPSNADSVNFVAFPFESKINSENHKSLVAVLFCRLLLHATKVDDNFYHEDDVELLSHQASSRFLCSQHEKFSVFSFDNNKR